MFILLVGEVAIFDPQEWGSQLVGGGEDEHAGGVLDDFFNQLHFLNCFDPRLDE